MRNTTTKQNIIMKVTKPKPPLTAYNLFFQVERKRILEGTDSFGIPISNEDLKLAVWTHKAKTGKRLHRKTHGKIGFKELACVVANRWKKLDPRTRRMLEDHAQMEKQEYMFLMEEWKKKYEKHDHETIGQIEQHNTNLQEMLSKSKQQQQPVRLQSSSSSRWIGNVDDKPKLVSRMNDFERLQSMWRKLVSESSVDASIDDEPLQLNSARIMQNGFSNRRQGGSMNFLGHSDELSQQVIQDYPNSAGFFEESCYLLSHSDNMHSGQNMRCAHTKGPWDSMAPINDHVLEPTPILKSGTAAAVEYLGCLTSAGIEPALRNIIRGHGPKTGWGPMKSNGCHGQGNFSAEEKTNPCLLLPEDMNQWDELSYFASLLEPF